MAPSKRALPNIFMPHKGKAVPGRLMTAPSSDRAEFNSQVTSKTLPQFMQPDPPTFQHCRRPPPARLSTESGVPFFQRWVEVVTKTKKAPSPEVTAAPKQTGHRGKAILPQAIGGPGIFKTLQRPTDVHSIQSIWDCILDHGIQHTFDSAEAS
ncbi:hypothetical protein LTR37_018472 [Vermiconidia calcicola]|uniref:Uncharacterized protein n=1 Tax=Vermiconidia calcicola TaxID=1690605 RepID=A0ACC3MI10_9PEZI|nr:hypothetical protein LTR37_018472 [Vermiconidia calcicola]